jgi:hypothetical protein
MSKLSTDHRLLLLQMVFNADAEMAHYDQAIGQLIARRRKQVLPLPRRGRIYKKKQFWIKPWLYDRTNSGQYHFLMNELYLKDDQGFRNFTRMPPEMFFALLERLTPIIIKRDTFWREAISPGFRFALTLRFYATGDSFMSLSYNWKVGSSTISSIVPEVSEAIIKEFAQDIISPPVTPQGWKEVANQFETRWNFPHAMGALDGKHVPIRCPANSGSLYYNYKGFYSIVMMALVDADYKFIWLDVGANGSNSDAQIWNSCELLDCIEKGTLGIPKPEQLPEDDGRDIPYFIIGDDAFALQDFLMKPHSRRGLSKEEKIFNYRLSRARRIVENAFGILSSRFGCFYTTMRQTPLHVTSTIIACCCLHNLLRINSPNLARNPVIDDDPDQILDHNLIDGRPRARGNNGKKSSKDIREYLTKYFNSPNGAVEWQDRMI